MLSLEDQTKAENGLVLTWLELVKVSGIFSQVIEMTLIATDPSQPMVNWPAPKERRTGFILVEVIDSTFWAVESDMGDALLAIKNAYTEVRQVPEEHS